MASLWRVRNRYLDLLRAVAIIRVVVYHLFGWPWLTMVMPAMGVMFALAGSLTAASLDKRDGARTVSSRLRRLLPPLWILGLVGIPLMVVAGWRSEGGDHPFSLGTVAFWVLPIGDPVGSDRGLQLWEPLWYIRAYLWFLLLSPVLHLAYRKAGWLVVAAPLVLILGIGRADEYLPDQVSGVVQDFAVYAACWIAGFAHHDGRLGRLRAWQVLALAAALGAGAWYWLRGHHADGYDLNGIPVSQALWSLAFVLLVLRWQPPMDWLARFRPLDATVTVLNQRALTIYLWHNIAIAAIWPELSIMALDNLGRLDGPADLISAFVLTWIAVLCFGWAEDLAARRRPHLWPPTPATSPAAAPERADPDRTTEIIVVDQTLAGRPAHPFG
jgi:peptidoglycan/LPS O-acetylase OafA/YrhL